MTPHVNGAANKLTKFPHPDESLQTNFDKVYPGQSACNGKASAPHAKWHVQSANALFDLAYLCDKVNKFTGKSRQVGAAEAIANSQADVISMHRFGAVVESVL